MARLKTVNIQAELGEFNDILTLQTIDGKTEAIVVNYKGKELRIVVGGTYSNNLKCLIEEPQVEVIKYQVEGKIRNFINVKSELFDDKYAAQNYLECTLAAADIASWGREDYTVEVKEVIVLVDADKIN